MTKTAKLYRMVMDKHVCPYGTKSKWLLEKEGYQVEDHHLAALGDNGFGRGLAQTGCSAGDHGNFIGNIHMLSLW